MPARSGSAVAVVDGLEPIERNVAMVFQSYALYPHMTVFNNQAFSLKLRKVPKEEITHRRDARQRARSGWRAFSTATRGSYPAVSASASHGPGHRAFAGSVPVRRAAVEP